MNTPIFEENDLDHFKGIDIMRAVRSFDPCLPCGVHMYLGKGKTLKKLHSPTPPRASTGGGGVPDLHAVADRIESLLDELRSATEGGRGSGSRSWFACSPSSTARAWPEPWSWPKTIPISSTRLGGTSWWAASGPPRPAPRSRSSNGSPGPSSPSHP